MWAINVNGYHFWNVSLCPEQDNLNNILFKQFKFGKGCFIHQVNDSEEFLVFTRLVEFRDGIDDYTLLISIPFSKEIDDIKLEILGTLRNKKIR